MSENESKENIVGTPDELAAETPEVPAKADKTDGKADKAKKAKSDGKKSKPSLISRISRWWREMKVELKKVQWPGRKQTINNTLVVMLCVVVVGVFIWAFDWLANGIIDALLALFKG